MARPAWDKRPRTTKKIDVEPAQAKPTVKAAEKAAAKKKVASPKAPASPKAASFNPLAAGFGPAPKKKGGR